MNTDTLTAGRTFPSTAVQRFTFRFLVVFFRGEIFDFLTSLAPRPYNSTLFSLFLPVGPHHVPEWFKALWPPCPGCDYNPMYWQAEFPWCALTALVGAIVWRLIDRDRVDYFKFYKVWHVVMRYVFGTRMIDWGFFKLMGWQFWGLHADAFLIARPLGEWAGRALMWNTMGQSVVYGMFTGAAEAVGGILVLFRGSSLFGALLLLFVNITIFILDALMNRGGITGDALWGAFLSGTLVALQWRRLRTFYVRNEPVAPVAEPPMIGGKWHVVLKLLIIGMLMSKQFHFTFGLEYLWKGTAGQNAGWMNIPHFMTGTFKVESMTRNGARVVSRHDDSTQWAYLGFGGTRAHSTNMRGGDESPTAFFIIRPDGVMSEAYAFKLDSVEHTMTVDTAMMPRALQGMQFKTWHSQVDRPFTYEWHDIDHLDLTAYVKGDTITARLARMQVYETGLFGSRRIVRSNYGSPIRWKSVDSAKTKAPRASG